MIDNFVANDRNVFKVIITSFFSHDIRSDKLSWTWILLHEFAFSRNSIHLWLLVERRLMQIVDVIVILVAYHSFAAKDKALCFWFFNYIRDLFAMSFIIFKEETTSLIEMWHVCATFTWSILGNELHLKGVCVKSDNDLDRYAIEFSRSKEFVFLRFFICPFMNTNPFANFWIIFVDLEFRERVHLE